MAQKAKHFKTRVQNKHATEAQWREAINFIPLAGELIIYDIDDTHSSPRFKIGDGIVVWNDEHTEYTITGTKINDLPFTNNIETPDWNQNDATQPGYIKNRTHYIDKPSEVITFDGDTNGKDFIDLNDNELIVKVSDNTYTVEELIGGSMHVNIGYGLRLTEELIEQINGGLFIGTEDTLFALIVHNPDTFASSISEIFDIPPETNWTIGTYFLYVPSQSLWFSRLNLPETAVRLDPKYLPNGLPYTEPPLFNITWDGDKTDKQVIEIPEEEGNTLVKISDEILSDVATDFLGSQLTIIENGEMVVETIQTDSSIDFVPGCIVIKDMIYVIYDSDTYLANLPEEDRFDFTNGVYFMYITDPTDETYSAYVSSLVGASVIHKLDSKYLPDDINVTPESLGLATVATSGNYYDLINKPTIPAVSQFYQPTSSNAQSGKAVAEAINEIDDKKVNKILRSDVTDILEYDHTPDRVPYMYGVYGNEVYEEQQGLIKGSMGKLRKEMAAQIEKDDEKGAKSILSGVIPSKYRGILDPYTVAIRDSNCSIPVGYHSYDEDKDGNIINSKLYYGAAVPYSYVNAIADKKAVTSISVVENQTYEFDWNAMYFMKSNTNNKDIEILDGNGNRVTDYKYSYCLLILPKESFERTQWTVSKGEDRKKDTIHGLVAGMSDKQALIDTAKIEMLQFDVDPTKKLKIKPRDTQIYKIAF